MKKPKITLSTAILIGLVLGVVCGIFFGEYAAALSFIGDAFIRLLQMSILPFIVVSLIAGIGRLSLSEAKLLSKIAVGLILLYWGIAFLVIFAMPLAFPEMKTASFFSTSAVEIRDQIDFLDLFIPTNPFHSLADNLIPGVVVFSIFVGIAFIGIKGKESFLDDLGVLSAALGRVLLCCLPDPDRDICHCRECCRDHVA
jgi:Na+/H+-dicarboxylate symporter